MSRYYRDDEVELSAFRPQGNGVQYGFFQTALCVRILETIADGKRRFPAQKTAMGSFGRITSLNDLPGDKVMIELLHQAVELNEKGIKVAKKPVERKELVVPDDLKAALKKDKKAKAAFDAFTYSHQKEYIEWITEAKTEATRNKRLTTTIEWLSEGKSRNWKYANC